MIQFDILGGKTLVKEFKRKVQINTSVGVLQDSKKAEERFKDRKAIKPQAVVETYQRETSLIATIEKKVSLKNHQIVTTTHYIPENRHQSDNSLDNINQSDNSLQNIKGCTGEFNGYMSPNTGRYVKRIVENWLTAIELKDLNRNKRPTYENHIKKGAFSVNEPDGFDRVYVTFLTLTLPSKQIHGDNFLKNKCLDPMIEWLKDSVERNGRNGGEVDAYLWRAESQKNGNLHFHLIIDRWVDAERIRNQWNQIIERLDYIKMYRMTQQYIYRDGFRFREEQAQKQIEALQYVLIKAIEDRKIIPMSKYTAFDVEKEEIIDVIENGMLIKKKSIVIKNIIRETLNSIIQEAVALSPAIYDKRKRNKEIGLSEDTARILVYKMQQKAYEIGLETNWSDPNTTDIHKLGNIHSISSYITKYVSKSDIIVPKLAKNQRVLKKPGDEKPKIYTLDEGGSWDNTLDYYDPNAPEYKVTFTSRKVRGRIWGKSRNLSDGENGKKIQAAQFVVETKIIEKDERFGQTKYTTWNTNDDVSEYVNRVKEAIPAHEIERIADIIQSDYCEVIPLGKYAEKLDHKTRKKVKYFKPVKQLEFLKKMSPPLMKRYLNHYDNIYQMIYGSNAHSTTHYQTAA